jgi:hypothetical protein
VSGFVVLLPLAICFRAIPGLLMGVICFWGAIGNSRHNLATLSKAIGKPT